MTSARCPLVLRGLYFRRPLWRDGFPRSTRSAPYAERFRAAWPAPVGRLIGDDSSPCWRSSRTGIQVQVPGPGGGGLDGARARSGVGSVHRLDIPRRWLRSDRHGRGEDEGNDLQPSNATARTAVPSRGLVLSSLRFGKFLGGLSDRIADPRELGAPAAVGEKAAVANAHEALGNTCNRNRGINSSALRLITFGWA